MSSTPSNRLRLTPSNSPFLQRPARTPHRGRPVPDPRLSLKRVIGTTCASPTGFDTCQSSFAYIAGGAVVVVDVDGEKYNQRFYRARPTAVPVYNTSNQPHAQSTPTSTPKANDSRNRVSIPPRESSYGASDWAESPNSKTWTSRERIKAATCLSLSQDGKFLAVGETGYAPRVLIFGLQDGPSDRPLVSISEHLYGVNAVAWSPNTKFLASLGSANDGFLYLWKIDPRTGAAKLYQQNRCVSYVRDMIWMGNNLITLGVRHVKVWRVEEPHTPSPTKQRFGSDLNSPSQPQKTLPGRNTLLGELIEATFSCAVALDDTRAIICTESGDVCLLDDKGKQMKLTKVLEVGFVTTSIAIRDRAIHIGGKSGDFATLDLDLFLEGKSDCTLTTSTTSSGFLALGFLPENFVTVDNDHSIDIWNASYVPGRSDATHTRTHIPGNGDAMQGAGALQPNESKIGFYTWSGSGSIKLWDTDGNIQESLEIPLENAHFQNESEPVNQMTAVTATQKADYFVTGDKLGILKVTDAKTKECIFETKAHSSDCQNVTAFEDDSRFFIASSGRDRTAQLFHRTSDGQFELFQTLEFAAKVVQVIIPSPDKVITCALDRSLQVHEIVSKESEPDELAAFPVRSLPLKASPTSMVMAPDGKSIIVSLLDRSVCIYDIETGKLSTSFKCADETGVESVVLDSLICRPATEKEPAFLLGLSNTDKSIRVYDASTGSFLDREWGHTEAITGVTLVQETGGCKKIVSVGSDGTIMIWRLDLQEQLTGSVSRDPSPVKDALTAVRAPLRRVLSKADLAEFQRPSSASGRRSPRSPPRTLSKRRSLFNLNSSGPLRTPTSTLQLSPSAIEEGTPTRRTSTGSRTSSPPVSPKSRSARRPSLPALNKTKSNSSLRGSMNLTMATEQICRNLRSYRKKLDTGGESISENVLAELDQELRLTSLALGDRAKQSRELGNSLLDGILDQYSARLASMLDEKLRLNSQSSGREGTGSPEDNNRPVSSGAGSLSTTDSNYSQ